MGNAADTACPGDRHFAWLQSVHPGKLGPVTSLSANLWTCNESVDLYLGLPMKMSG